MFDASAIDALRDVFASVCRDFEAEYPRNVAVSSLVSSLKGISAARARRPDLRQRYWKGTLWSLSYFAASCGGIEPPRRQRDPSRPEERGLSWSIDLGIWLRYRT